MAYEVAWANCLSKGLSPNARNHGSNKNFYQKKKKEKDSIKSKWNMLILCSGLKLHSFKVFYFLFLTLPFLVSFKIALIFKKL